MVRHNNRLPYNLPQLQNLIKRDPASYKDEFTQQYNHYSSMLEIFGMRPTQYSKELDELIMFIAQVSHCYINDLKSFPQQLMDILSSHHTVLNPEMRMTFCKALILLRNKNLLAVTDLLSLFFLLLKCQDKALRQFLETHIVTDIKNTNSKHKDAKVNSTLQNFMFGMMKDNNAKAAKMSLDIMIELYKKNVWNDAKTVNVIATACFSKFNKVLVAALKFFLGSDKIGEKGSDDDSDSDGGIDLKDVMMANRVNKKTRKRKRQLEKAKTLVKKSKKKKSAPPVFNFSALHLLHDPQEMAEKLFHRLEAANEKFEIKLLILEVISRLIGIHQLILLNYYPYIQRYLQPHQREVTKMLQFLAQASHELVPPELLESVVKVIVYNFVTERNSSDVMAIGLNAIREICARCPLAMSEVLMKDLAIYKNYKVKSVMMAAKSLIHLYRLTVPNLLKKKDRGKPTEAIVSLKVKQFGDVDVKDHVPGAEVLLTGNDASKKEDCNEDEDDDGDDNDSWIDVSHSEDEQDDEEGEAESDDNCADVDDNDSNKEVEECDDNTDHNTTKDTNDSSASAKRKEVIKDKEKQAAQASLDRILTDEDFKKIDAAQIKKQMSDVKKGKKRPIDETVSREGLVSLKDIEFIYKKRKQSKEERIESVRAGQEGREKYGFKDRRVNPLCSKTNKEKRKTKAFAMIKHKAKRKVKRSFKDKQISLRNHLLKVKRLK